MSSSATAVITNAAAKNACRRSGLSGEIDLARFNTKLLTLESLERTAQQAAEEAEKAINDIAFWENVIIVSKVAQVGADWFIEFASQSKVAPKWISPAYGGVKNVVAILNSDFTAQKLLKETAKIIVKGTREFAKEAGHKSVDDGLKVAARLAKAAEDIHDLKVLITRKTDDGGVRGARATALQQVVRIRGQIAELRAIVASCASPSALDAQQSLRLP